MAIRIASVIRVGMTPFPALKLPWLALRRVIEQAERLDIFHFSLCSAKCRQAVQTTRPETNMIHWDLHDHANVINVYGESSCYFQITIFERGESVPDDRFVRLTVGYERFSQNVQFCRESNYIRLEVENSEARESLFKLLIAHLRSLFTCDQYNLNYKADPLDPDLLSHFLPIKTLIFEYTEEPHNKMFYFIGLERGTIENFRIRKEYYPYGHQDSLEASRELLPFRNMDFFYAPWLSFHNISTLDFANLRVGHPNLSNSDVNQILRLWSSGDYPHIESICFPTRETTWLIHTSWKMAEILDGLDVVEEEDVVLRIIRSANGLKARITCCDTFFGLAVLHPGMSEEKAQLLLFWQEFGYEQEFVKYLNAE